MTPQKRSYEGCLHVVIVSDNPETLDGLQEYLRASGVATRGTRDLEKFVELASNVPSAVVLFPDDYPWDQVRVALAELSRDRPRALPVLVTAEPKRFEGLLAVEDESRAVVIPKASWGWAILDAIRAQIDGRKT